MEAPATIVAQAEEWDRAGFDTYYGIGLRTAGLSPHRQGRIGDIIAHPGFYIDIDIASPAWASSAGGAVHASKRLPPDGDEAEKILAAAPAPPTAVVFTGYGLHAYWLYDEPFLCTGDAVRQELKRALKFFQKRLIDAGDKLGYHVDQTASVPRVFRLPGTHNHKRPSEPQDVFLVYGDGPRVSFAEIAKTVTPVMGRPRESGITKKEGAVVIAAEGWLGEVVSRLGRLKDPEQARMLTAVLAGKSFAEGGKRDESMQAVASVIAFIAFRLNQDATPAELVEILRPSLECWAAEEGAEKTIDEEIEKAQDKLERALMDAHDKMAIQIAAEERIARVFQRMSDRRERPQRPVIEVEVVASSTNTKPDLDEEEEEEEEPEAEVEPPPMSAADRQRLLRQLIIQHRTAYYVFDDKADQYLAPVTRDELEVAVRDDFEGCDFVDWYFENKEGSLSRKDTKRFLQDYCSVARNLVFDLTINQSVYDKKTSTFFEAVAPLRDIEPLFVPEIQEWLELLGGDDKESLLDWIATVMRLDRQTCALYLSGHPGAGKTMLAHGLARLWTTGEPTDLGQALGNFNADVLRCPLIVADEYIPGKRTSAELRLLIGTSGRTVSRKHLPNASLRGALRLMLCANNERLLLFGDEELDMLDLEAVAGRFLHISAPRAATKFLEVLGGREGTQHWVDGDLIARHARWLAEHRIVKSAGRFLVQGHATRMHRSLIMQGLATSLVLEWVARFLDKPNPNPLQTEQVRCGEGGILVMATAISDHWDMYVRSHSVLSLTRIGVALKAVSLGTHTRNGRAFWRVDPNLIYEWSERYAVGNCDEMKNRVVGPMLVPGGAKKQHLQIVKKEEPVPKKDPIS